MSEDTPFKKIVFAGTYMPPNPLAICSKTRRPQIPSKKFPRENFLKWCNLVRFGVYFDQILSLK